MNTSKHVSYSGKLLFSIIFTLTAVAGLLVPASISIAAGGDYKWHFGISGDVYAPAVSTNGTIYVGGSNGNLYSLNSEKSENWHYSIGGLILSAPTIGSNGTIYVGSTDGKLYAIYSNGTEKWNYVTGSSITSSAGIDRDETIYAAVDGGNLYAFYSNGTEKWKYVTSSIYTNLIIDNECTIYVGTSDQKLYAISSDGTLKWTYKADSELSDSAAIDSKGTIYLGTTDGNLYAIKPDGTLKWKFKAGSGNISSPAIGSGGIIYFGSADNYLYALNQDGSEIWKYETGGIVESPSIANDGTIYVCSEDKKIYAINSDGTLRWSSNISGFTGYESPAISSDGSIYFKIKQDMGSNVLYKLEGDSGGLANTDWPKSQRNNQNTGFIEVGCVSPSETQADGITVSISASLAKTTNSTELASQYDFKGFTPRGDLNSFNATIDVNGGCATFKISSDTIPNGKVSDLTLMKFFDTNGTTKEYSDYPLGTPEYDKDGYWWLTDADGNYMAPTADTTLGNEYFIYFVVKDNGDYDEDRNLGAITDPVAIGTGSSSSSGSGSSTGCVFNPQATFSMEWLLLMLAPVIMFMRCRFKK